MTLEQEVLTADQLVELGAAVLDDAYPNWDMEIDLGTLDIGDGHYCILGQLYEGYYYGIVELAPEGQDPWIWATGHGFDAAVGVEADELTDAWLRVILNRREPCS